MLTGLQRGEYIYRINAGSALPLLDENNNVWQADAFFNAGTAFTAPFSLAIDTSLPGTLKGTGTSLYRSERYFDIPQIDLVYRLPVFTPGFYSVEIHLAEICTCVSAAGQRKFNIKVRSFTFSLAFCIKRSSFSSRLHPPLPRFAHASHLFSLTPGSRRAGGQET